MCRHKRGGVLTFAAFPLFSHTRDFHPRHERGQVLILFAAALGLLLLLVLGGFFLYSALHQRAAIGELVQAAARAGSLQVDDEGMLGGVLTLDVDRAEAATRKVLREGLPYLPYRIKDMTPEEVLEQAEVYVINVQGDPVESPVTGLKHGRPFVAVRHFCNPPYSSRRGPVL